MINTIAWKTYFVFFCFNIAFVPLVYFFFPETNGHKLEVLDAIFAEAHEKGENPVFTERRWRGEEGEKKAREIEEATADEKNKSEERSGSDATKVESDERKTSEHVEKV